MEWKEVSIKDVTTILGDGLHGTPIYDEKGDYFFINGNNLVNGHIEIKNDTKRVNQNEYEKHKKMLNGRTLFVSINGTIGNVAKYNGEKCILGKSACYFNVIDEVDRDFIYYVVSSPSFLKNITNQATGTTIKNVSLKQMREYSFIMPVHISDQRRIASILSSLDRKIELNNKINAQLEEMAQAIFKSWFVDFEPFKDGKFVESELGMIPEGWRVGTFADVIDFQNGFAFKSSDFVTDGRFIIITIKAVQDGNLTIENADTINELPVKMPNYCKLVEGDILLSLTGNVGRVCLVDKKDLLLNQRVAKLNPKYANDSMFVYTLFRRGGTKERLISISRGTAQANLSPIETSKLELVIPARTVLDRFAEITTNIYLQLINNRKENLHLSQLRDTLLPKLMSGEIDLDEIEKTI